MNAPASSKPGPASGYDGSAAIIGLGAHFPGRPGVSGYWSLVKNGLDAVTDIPKDRFLIEDYYDPDPKARDKIYVKRGAFLSPLAFEPLKYGIPPREMESVDSTQLLSLLVADAALTDAGYPADRANHGRTAVILGVTGALKMVVSLGSRLAHPQIRRAMEACGVRPQVIQRVLERFSQSFEPWTESSFPGLLGNVAAGRVASRLNLQGENMAVDAACASSLAAVSQALLALRAKKADLVVTGGADTFNDPFMFSCFSKTPALSRTGEARVFDRGGDGTMLGEGVGIVILKRLEDARRDGDRIYAVIRAAGSASDGRGASIFAPSAKGQTLALERAFREAGWEAREVELLEAHGTGTAVGDQVELSALQAFFGRDLPAADAGEKDPAAPPLPWCALGSVKSQIGHAKAAAGAAGLIKAALALHHKVLPPTIHVKKPLEPFSREGCPFYLNTRARPWFASPKHPRRAGVSAFGFGGSNFHVLLEEAGDVKMPFDAGVHLLPLAGKSLSAVALQIKDLSESAGLALSPLELKDPLLRPLAFSQALDSRIRPLISSFNPEAEEKVFLAFPGERAGSFLETLPEVLDARRRGGAGFKLPDGVFFGREKSPQGLIFFDPGGLPLGSGQGLDLALDFPHYQMILDLFSQGREGSPIGLLLHPPETLPESSLAALREELRDPASSYFLGPALAAALHELYSFFGLACGECAGSGPGFVSALIVGGFLPLKEAVKGLGAIKRPAELKTLRKTLEGLSLTLPENPGLPKLLGPDAEPVLSVARAREILLSELEEVLRAPGKGAEINGRAVKDPDTPKSPDDSPVKAENSTLKESAPFAGEDGEGGEDPSLPPALRFFLRRFPEKLLLLAGGPESPEAGFGEDFPKSAGEIDVDLLGRVLRNPTGALDLAKNLALLASRGVNVLFKNWSFGSFPTPKPRGHHVMLGGANLFKPAFAAGESDPRGGELSDFPLDLPEEGEGETQGRVLRLENGLAALQRNQAETLSILRSLERRIPPSAGAPSPAALFGAPSPAPLRQAPPPEEGDPTLPAASGSLLKVVPNPGFQDFGSSFREKDPAPPEEPRRADSPGADSAPPRSAAAESFYALIAKETGYPREALRADMDLENDLGLDSIKKVELLSEAARVFPGFQSDPGALTLGALAALCGVAPSPESPAPPSRRPASAPRGFGEGPPEPPSGRTAPAELPAARERVLQIIAAETGYPAETLTGSLSLEGDLGLDSIKKVEILSLIGEFLPAGDPGVLGAAETIDDILKTLPPAEAPGPVSAAGGLPGGGDPPDRPKGSLRPLSRVGPLGTRSSALDVQSSPRAGEEEEGEKEDRALEDLEKMVLRLVSRETGYPEESLSPGLDLENDLGLDSIKKVELLSLLTEEAGKRSALKEAGTELQRALSASSTLGDWIASLALLSRKRPRGLPAPPDPLRSPLPLAAFLDAPNPRDPKIPRKDAPFGEASAFPPPGRESVSGGLPSDWDGESGSAGSPHGEGVPEETGVKGSAPAPREGSGRDVFPGVINPGFSVRDPDGLNTGSLLGEGGPRDPSPPFALMDPDYRHGEAAPLSRGGAPRAPRAKPGERVPRGGERQAAVFRVESQPLNPLSGEADLKAHSPVILVGGSPQADFLAGGLKERGLLLKRVSWRDDFSSLFQSGSLDVEGEKARSLVLVWPGSDRDPFLARQALAILKEAGPSLSSVAGVTSLGGNFSRPGNGEGPRSSGNYASAALLGLIRTIALEWPEIRTRVIDLPLAAHEMHLPDIQERVVERLFSDGPLEIGIPSSERSLSLALSPVEISGRSNPGGPPALKPGDTLVATGALRGLTALVLKELAAQERPDMVILGLDPLGPPEPPWLSELKTLKEIKARFRSMFQDALGAAELHERAELALKSRALRETLTDLENLGSRVEYLSGDFLNPEVLDGALRFIRRERGPVKGLVHGAGALDGGWIEDFHRLEFSRVYATGAETAARLLEAFQDEPLSLILFLSPAPEAPGELLPAGFSAAGEVLRKIAWDEAGNRPEAKVLSISWAQGAYAPQSAPGRRGGAPKAAASPAAGLLRDLLRLPADSPQELLVLGAGRGRPRTGAPRSGGPLNFGGDS
ncbi:MAG: KR domain-containing protein [Deltaproteobacteria bacterium]|jgi:3-oxoacyl-(acyl-carrier-protein) synthase/acyl carrier protein|nr:KR domain-containing protein [Deltaproteobacteria bacterium]